MRRVRPCCQIERREVMVDIPKKRSVCDGSRRKMNPGRRLNLWNCSKPFPCFAGAFLIVSMAHGSTGRIASGPLVISGQNGKTIENLHITSSKGPCLTITNSTGITIHNSEIGPCRGNGIVVSGGNGIRIVDNYIHPEFTGTACCDTGDGIFASATTNILIQGNVIAYGESNIEIVRANTVNVIGNFLVNPRNYGGNRGTNIQIIGQPSSKSILVENNYTLASQDKSVYAFPEKQTDSINFGGGASGIIARNNYIAGGFWAYGCGLIVDSGADHAQFLDNTVVDTGQCGIAIEGGVDHIVSGNKVLNRNPVKGGGNTAMIVFKLYATDPPCGRVNVTNNTAFGLKPDGQVSPFWKGDGCEPVTMSGNTFDSDRAWALMTPAAKKLPPPLIPPRPFSCTVRSPFSNQKSPPPCSNASVR
jgi:hypothetical protein